MSNKRIISSIDWPGKFQLLNSSMFVVYLSTFFSFKMILKNKTFHGNSKCFQDFWMTVFQFCKSLFFIESQTIFYDNIKPFLKT